LEEIVALKEYLYEPGNNIKSLYEKVIKEFRMLSNLEHQNIIKYFCIFKPEKIEVRNKFQFGIIMEFMAGGSLE